MKKLIFTISMMIALVFTFNITSIYADCASENPGNEVCFNQDECGETYVTCGGSGALCARVKCPDEKKRLAG